LAIKTCGLGKKTWVFEEKGIDKRGRETVLATFHSLPGSSVAEQVTVNHLVVGSIPTRAAILAPRTFKSFWGFFVPGSFILRFM
jgi:hypothetical protein